MSVQPLPGDLVLADHPLLFAVPVLIPTLVVVLLVVAVVVRDRRRGDDDADRDGSDRTEQGE